MSVKSKMTYLNGYWLVVHMSVVMKFFERQSTPASIMTWTRFSSATSKTDPQQMWSCWLSTMHLNYRYTYVRLLLIDCGSAFNIIIPSKLIVKLGELDLRFSRCNWILGILIDNLVEWWKKNNLALDISKTKELIIDVRMHLSSFVGQQ